ncbi:MAG TPA: methyltransferase domain-containing protein [Candidatus Dormibacteraeota bacterium]|nr:methyltransferase domain-containing protein [Candidatus Dormibacteraeota bacterium]
MGAQVAATSLDRWDEVADCYDATRGGEVRGRRQARGLAPLLRRGVPVVDLGTGTGVVAMGLREQGFAVVGLDVSARMLNQARRRLGTGLLRADVARLPLADGSVTQCLSVWLLHCVPDPGAVLAEVARVLRPGGRYLVLPADCPLDADADWVTRLLDELQLRLEVRGNDASNGHAALDLETLADRAGMRLVAQHKLATAACEVPAADTARDLERRAYRWLLDVDEGAWQEVVAPAITRLRGAAAPVLRRTRPEVVYILELRGA